MLEIQNIENIIISYYLGTLGKGLFFEGVLFIEIE